MYYYYYYYYYYYVLHARSMPCAPQYLNDFVYKFHSNDFILFFFFVRD